MLATYFKAQDVKELCCVVGMAGTHLQTKMTRKPKSAVFVMVTLLNVNM